MNELKEYFRKKFKKTGVALTISQLIAYAKEKGLKKIDRAALGKFVHEEQDVAKFSIVKRPKGFQTIGVLRPGVYFIDYAAFEAKLQGFNEKKPAFY